MSILNFNPNFVELIDYMGQERRVVNAARVSFNKEVNEFEPLDEKDIKLVKYLREHNHNSPFFHIMLSFRIKMPIFIMREWYRSTVGFARNEISRRYVDSKVECFLPESLRKKHPSKKQGSLEESVKEEDELLKLMEESTINCTKLYDDLINKGVAPEQARIILPQSMYSTFIETASLDAYLRLIKLRTSDDAMYEIRQYANRVYEIIKELFPNLVE